MGRYASVRRPPVVKAVPLVARRAEPQGGSLCSGGSAWCVRLVRSSAGGCAGAEGPLDNYSVKSADILGTPAGESLRARGHYVPNCPDFEKVLILGLLRVYRPN